MTFDDVLQRVLPKKKKNPREDVWSSGYYPILGGGGGGKISRQIKKYARDNS